MTSRKLHCQDGDDDDDDDVGDQKSTVTAGPGGPKSVAAGRAPGGPKGVAAGSGPGGPKGVAAGGGPGGPKSAAACGGRTTAFAVGYGRPGFPVAAVYGAGVTGRRFQWLVPFETVDYEIYVPIFMDGLRERRVPYGVCAAQALWDLLARDASGGERVLAALPRSVFPLRRALDAGPRDWPTVVRALSTLQRLATAGRDGRVGRALVPYYRVLLQPLNRYLRGDAADVAAADGVRANVTHNVRDLCADTLTLLEYTGGQCAYANIKYVIPTYESTGSGGSEYCYDGDDAAAGVRPAAPATTVVDDVARTVAPTPSLESVVNVTDGGG